MVAKLAYVATERLADQRFLEMIRELDAAMVAVDEAHCVSQWGQDFRPSYLHIPDFIASLSRCPVPPAFTATATREIWEDIIRLLGLADPCVVVTGFDRLNLFFDVKRLRNKLAALEAILAQHQGQSGISYCATRVKVEQMCRALEDREVATNAFSMGIDKSNVSFSDPAGRQGPARQRDGPEKTVHLWTVEDNIQGTGQSVY